MSSPLESSYSKSILKGYVQNSFIGGMDMISNDTQVQDDAYIWLVNGRQRFGYIEPVKRNLLIATPSGKKQGGISIGNIKIIFVAGRAYYQEDGETVWIQVPSFLMSSKANIFWSQAVPASTFNFVRKLDTGLSIHAPIRATTDFEVAGTPAAIVVQDGINQPWIIEYDSTNQVFTSRVTGTYYTWSNISETTNDREYVPIGRQMMYKDSILHVVSPDGKSVYRSVTGRALDFMVNVDVNGNKLSTEALGGAATTSYAFDFDEITCLTEIDSQGTFVYGTKHNIRILVSDYSRTIFGEPSFQVASLIKNTGIVNQYCFTEVLNDYVFISNDSAKQFNAVQQLKFKGNSSIFTKQLSRLLFNTTTKKPIQQKDCSCIGFQNYVLFNLDTLWGNLVAVYDVLLERWVSLDITTATRIKQYFTIETETEIKLYAITHYDELYQLYGSNDSEVPELRVKGFIAPMTSTEHKSVMVRPFFNGGTFDGKIFLSEYVDDQLSTDEKPHIDYRYSQDLKAALAGINYPVIPPVFPNNISHVDNPGFSLTKGLAGKKISFILQWTNDAQLIELMLTTSEQDGQTSVKQRDITYKDSYE